tara:strand:- start:309 stop:779 length:471 start_codon:yes stop_codon:yes gene_type:complete
MNLTEAKLKELILETLEETSQTYKQKIRRIGKIITTIIKTHEGPFDIQRGQTSDKERNMIEFTMMKDMSGGMGFIKGILKYPPQGSVNRPDVLGITVNTTSLTNDPDFNYIHEEDSFKFDDIIQDEGEALSKKINDYVAALGGEMSAGAEIDTGII